MAEGTIKKYLKYCLISLRICGLWTDADTIFGTRFFWIWYLTISVFLIGLFNLAQFVHMLLVFGDLEQFTMTAHVLSVCLMANVKAIFYCKHFPLLKKILSRLDEEDFQPRNSRQKRKVFETMKIFILAQVLFLACVIVLSPVWITSPLLIYKERRLPFAAWYPFDHTKMVPFLLCYIHQSISITLIVFLNSVADLMTIGLIAYVGIECDILCDILRNIEDFTKLRLKNEEGLSAESVPKIQEEMNKTLLDCVRYHWEILKFSKDANKIFNTYVFILFATSMIGICLTLFELSIIPFSAQVVSYISYELAIFYELLIYCWFGNDLIVKSDRLAYSLYESAAWIDGSPEFKRNMIFFVLRTNEHPIVMQVIDFFTLSLATFSYIVRASWSFFMMLHQVHNKKIYNQQSH